MKFRFVLQPMMAAFYAARDGMKDAEEGRPAYFWAIVTHPSEGFRLLGEGWRAVLRVIVLGAVMDAIYQVMVFRHFYPIELVIIVLSLAFVPYVLLRGPVNRILQWLHSHKTAAIR